MGTSGLVRHTKQTQCGSAVGIEVTTSALPGVGQNHLLSWKYWSTLKGTQISTKWSSWVSRLPRCNRLPPPPTIGDEWVAVVQPPHMRATGLLAGYPPPQTFPKSKNVTHVFGSTSRRGQLSPCKMSVAPHMEPVVPLMKPVYMGDKGWKNENEKRKSEGGKC